MILFLMVLFLLGIAHTGVNISLLSKKRQVVLFCIFLFGLVLLIYPLAIRTSLESAEMMIREQGIVSLVCTYQVIESIVFMLFSLWTVRVHYERKVFSKAGLVPLLPSGIFLSGIFLASTYIFNTVRAGSFFGLALSLATVIIVTVLVGSFILRKLIPVWEIRMELKILLSFFQLTIAMALPLVLLGLRIHGTQIEVHAQTALFSWIAMLIIVLAGKLFANKKRRRSL